MSGQLMPKIRSEMFGGFSVRVKLDGRKKLCSFRLALQKPN